MIFIHLISSRNDEPWFLISCSSYTSLECLTNWLSEVDCKNVLSTTFHEKDTKLFNSLKYPIAKYIAEIYWLRYLRNVLMSENLVFWDLVGHHSNCAELLFRVVVANLCSWPDVKRKVHISYNFIVFLSVTKGNIY